MEKKLFYLFSFLMVVFFFQGCYEEISEPDGKGRLIEITETDCKWKLIPEKRYELKLNSESHKICIRLKEPQRGDCYILSGVYVNGKSYNEELPSTLNMEGTEYVFISSTGEIDVKEKLAEGGNYFDISINDNNTDEIRTVVLSMYHRNDFCQLYLIQNHK